MIVNLFALVLIAAVVLGILLSVAAPSVALSLLTLLRIFAPGSLSFEKYEHIDSRNYKSQRSRYFRINKDGYKNTVTGKVIFWMVLISVFMSVMLLLSFLLIFITV